MKTNFLVWQRVMVALFALISTFSSLQAQMRVGLPSAPPDKSAALEVNGGPYSSGSAYRGLLPPKVALGQSSSALPITQPATGLLVYNTAIAGDVTPGFYYWEGTRWVRFETAGQGAARIAAAGGGQYIPAYTLSEVRSLSTTPDNLILVEPAREGLYRYDFNDLVSQDNGGTILVTAAGKRFKLQHNGEVSITQFGAIPNDGLDDTDALRRAVLAGVSLIAPEGTYEVVDSIAVVNSGDFRLRGAGVGATFSMNADKNMFVFVSDTSGGGGYMDLRNLRFSAGVNMSSGAAIKIRGGLTQKVAVITDCVFTRPSLSQEWKYGIWCENPVGLVVRDSEFRGNGPSKFIGIALTSTQASIAPFFSHIQVYDAYRGIQARTNSFPGIEGIKISNSDFVGCDIGADIQSTYNVATYVPPGVQFDQCHINSFTTGILLKNYVQASINDCILYMNGSIGNVGIILENISQASVVHNKLFRVGSGAAYGVVANTGTNINLQVNFNQFILAPTGTEQAIWFNSTTSYSQALYNMTTGISGSSGNGFYNQSGTSTDVGNTKN
jgi:hypothetical protein